MELSLPLKFTLKFWFMMNNKERIFLSPPHMSEERFEQGYVNQAFDSNWIAPLGPNVLGFEKEIEDYLQNGYAVALSSGTAALHLALLLLGVENDDEVFCSTFTFSASANAITYQNAKPVFIDSDKISWNMDPDLLAEALKKKAVANKLPKAVVVVDLYGQCADYDRINKICNEYNVPVLEDAAEALGASYKGKKAGTLGKFGILSFNGNKIITSSGGGMLIANSKDEAAKALFYATQARDDTPYYQHSSIGYNYRMSNVVAGVGRGQLKVLDQRVKRKHELFKLYQNGMKDLPFVSFMPQADFGESNRWLTCMLLDPKMTGVTPEQIRQKLELENIESRPVWKPMHLQPVFNSCESFGGNVSEGLFKNGLCLPSGTAMKDEDVLNIISIIKSLF